MSHRVRALASAENEDPQIVMGDREALHAAPRGREPEPPGERFWRAILAGLPNIEAMEVVERFFELEAQVVRTPHPVGIFLAGCRECLAEWEVQAARGRRAPSPSAD